MPNLTSQSLGRYHIFEQLGKGSMATVYNAYAHARLSPILLVP